MHPSVDYVCDLCDDETPAHDHVALTWDRKTYRLDLCAKHRALIDRSVERWTARMDPPPARRTRTESAPTAGYTPRAVRAWAKKKKIDLPDKGRIPGSVVTAYLADLS